MRPSSSPRILALKYSYRILALVLAPRILARILAHVQDITSH